MKRTWFSMWIILGLLSPWAAWAGTQGESQTAPREHRCECALKAHDTCSCSSAGDCTCKKGACKCSKCGQKSSELLVPLKGQTEDSVTLPSNAKLDASAGSFI